MIVTMGPYPDDEDDRFVEVILHEYDTWSLDHTLSHIIAPCLKQLKETTHGAPSVDNEDVPEELWRPENFSEHDCDENWFARWEYVLDEMIWAFETIKNSDGFEDLETEERIQNGCRLFGKYYRGFWS